MRGALITSFGMRPIRPKALLGRRIRPLRVQTMAAQPRRLSRAVEGLPGEGAGEEGERGVGQSSSLQICLCESSLCH